MDADRQVLRFAPEGLGGEVVYMTPDQYLALSPPMKGNPVKDAKARELRDSTSKGEAIRTPPSLEIAVENGVGKVMGQDGRHRAQLAKEKGVELIPVQVEKKGAGGDFDRVVGMRGEEIAWEVKKPRKWSEISAEPKFKAMSPENQERARARYFDEVVSPTLPSGARDQARTKWSEMKPGAGTKRESEANPTTDMSGFDRFRSGFGKAFVDVARGAGQYVGAVSRGDVERSRQVDKPLMDTTGGTLGNIAGNMALFAPTALVPGANTVVGAGLGGAIAGALQPSTSTGETASNIGLGTFASSGITALGRLGPMLKRAFVDPFRDSGQARIALDQLTRFAHDPNAIKNVNATELVPGSRPSLAEATGDPGIAQVQRAAQAKQPEVASAFADARTKRLAARKDALAKVAGDEGEKDFFEAAREATAERLYKKAFSTPINPKKLTPAVQTEITELMERPSMKEAVKRSWDLAKESGLSLTEDPKDYVQRLHWTKKALDEQIEKAHDQPSLQRALLGTKEKLVGVLDKVSPKYAEARAQYQADSKPIARMEIGKYLQEKLLPALNDFGTERYRPESFAKALRDGDAMAKKATGFKGARLSDILTEEQTKTLTDVAKDLAREAAAGERAKVAGSPTAQYMAGANMLRQIAGPLGLPESWVESTVGKTLAHWTGIPMKAADEKIAGHMAEFLTNPKLARAAAESQLPLEFKIGGQTLSLADLAKRGLPPIAIGSGSYAAEQ